MGEGLTAIEFQPRKPQASIPRPARMGEVLVSRIWPFLPWALVVCLCMGWLIPMRPRPCEHMQQRPDRWCPYGALPGYWTAVQSNVPGTRWRVLDPNCPLLNLLSVWDATQQQKQQQVVQAQTQSKSTAIDTKQLGARRTVVSVTQADHATPRHADGLAASTQHSVGKPQPEPSTSAHQATHASLQQLQLPRPLASTHVPLLLPAIPAEAGDPTLTGVDGNVGTLPTRGEHTHATDPSTIRQAAADSPEPTQLPDATAATAATVTAATASGPSARRSAAASEAAADTQAASTPLAASNTATGTTPLAGTSVTPVPGGHTSTPAGGTAVKVVEGAGSSQGAPGASLGPGLMFLSDSVDKHILTHLCELAGGRVVLMQSDGAPWGPMPRSAAEAAAMAQAGAAGAAGGAMSTEAAAKGASQVLPAGGRVGGRDGAAAGMIQPRKLRSILGGSDSVSVSGERRLQGTAGGGAQPGLGAAGPAAATAGDGAGTNVGGGPKIGAVSGVGGGAAGDTSPTQLPSGASPAAGVLPDAATATTATSPTSPTTSSAVIPPGQINSGGPVAGGSMRYLAHTCELPAAEAGGQQQARLRLLATYIPGVHPTGPYHKGVKFGWRQQLDEAVRVWNAAPLLRGHPPDIVVVASTLWDLARLAAHEPSQLAGPELSPGLLQSWSANMTAVVRSVRRAIPEALLVATHTTMPPKFNVSTGVMDRGNLGRRFFITQLNAAVKEVARQEGLELVDYASMASRFFEGQSYLGDGLHPGRGVALELANVWLNLAMQARTAHASRREEGRPWCHPSMPCSHSHS